MCVGFNGYLTDDMENVCLFDSTVCFSLTRIISGKGYLNSCQVQGSIGEHLCHNIRG